jgi:putative ABC transport system permease protein
MTRTDLAERFKALFLRDRAEKELDEELRYHMEREAEARALAGSATPERDARIALGGVEQVKEEVRSARGVRALEELVADTRYALRALGRNFGFTLTVIAVLGIAIGAATAVYTVVNRVLLADLPYPDAGRLVRIRQRYSPTSFGTISAVDILAVHEQQRSFDAFGAIRFGNAAVPGPGGPEVVASGRVTSGFFKALGVRTEYGRLLEPADDVPGAPPMVVVSHRYAERALGGAPAAVGKAITIDGVSHTVAGVLEKGRPDILGSRAAVWTALQIATPNRRGPFGFNGVARLKEGVTLEQATRDLDEISVRIFPIWAAGFQDSSARLVPQPLREAIVGRATRQVGLFAGAVALVLLLAIANVATLMLVRASAREHELAVRVALGAGRYRVVRLMLTECVALTLIAGAVGIAIAAMALGLVAVVAPGLPRLSEVALDGRSIAFALIVALVSGVLVSLAPLAAIFSHRSPVSAGLLSSPARGGASRRSNAVRGALVIAEFALALPLLLGAGLLANSFLRLQRVDAGFEPRGVMGLGLFLPPVRYRDSTFVSFWRQLEARALSAEGVTAAGLTSSLPPDNFGDVNNFDLIDRPVPAGTSQHLSPWPIVTNGYFAAMGVPLLEGRLFDQADTANGAPVLIVSRAWAARYYPGTSPIGRQMHSGGCSDCPPETIIGVVGDVLYQGLAGEGVAVYAPIEQGQPRALTLVVRSSAPSAATLRSLRSGVASLDPELAPTDIVLTERLDDALGDPRRWASVVGAFAAAGALLAALGIFGLMSYVVRQRRREIGVRIALGATPQDLVWFVLNRGMRYALVGTALGLAVSALESRWLGSLLYGVGAYDPFTVALAVTALLAIAIVACLLPGLRAVRIRPVEALGAD